MLPPVCHVVRVHHILWRRARNLSGPQREITSRLFFRRLVVLVGFRYLSAKCIATRPLLALWVVSEVWLRQMWTRFSIRFRDSHNPTASSALHFQTKLPHDNQTAIVCTRRDARSNVFSGILWNNTMISYIVHNTMDVWAAFHTHSNEGVGFRYRSCSVLPMLKTQVIMRPYRRLRKKLSGETYIMNTNTFVLVYTKK